jgi:HSP20 family protein
MSSTPTRWDPFSEIIRDSGNLVLRANLPGITPEELSIELDNDVLTVSGHHEEHKDEEGEQHVRHERRYGAFSRSVLVPPGVDRDAITATASDGVVQVTVPLPGEANESEG